ncbi:MAG: DUF3307 domain-containing protein [Chloroflexi bacterium]|jgi:hypothetical protein|nr:DUF3307 domain-containing protein [Chloroflexota bacterium]
MFWTLLLADIIADYPLQSDRLVVAKKRLPGLVIHVAIHWVVMTLLLWSVLAIVWPYILAIVAIHFAIDSFKNYLGRIRPHWVINTYLLDQLLHVTSLVLVSALMAQSTELPVWQITKPWVAYALGLLLATHVWFVTERILYYRNDEQKTKINATMWPRIGVRLVVYLSIVAASLFSWLLALPAIIIIPLLYGRVNYPRWWSLLDIGVPAISALIVRLILAIYFVR